MAVQDAGSARIGRLAVLPLGFAVTYCIRRARGVLCWLRCVVLRKVVVWCHQREASPDGLIEVVLVLLERFTDVTQALVINA